MTDILVERGLPANLDAERGIFGLVMLDNSLYWSYRNELPPSAFATAAHRTIAVRIDEMIAGGRAVDLVTLSEELGRHKELQNIGGVAYLASLTEGLPRSSNLGDRVQIVRDKWALRESIRVFSEAVTRAADQSESADELIPDIDRQLLEIAHGTEREPNLRNQNAEAFRYLEAVRRREIEPSVSSGTSSVDRIIGGGYKKAKLYVVGGRPSMGKTSLMGQAAIQHCARGIRTRIVSLEMTAEELLHRLYAAIAEVPFERIMQADCLSDEEWSDVNRARSLVDGWPLEIDDRDGQTIDRALAGCRMSCRRRGTGFVALDYIQNLTFTGLSKLRYQEISDAAKRCRQFAKEENVPFLLLSSITESGEKNPNKRPVLADLRGSGDLSFHADVAVLIHRERLEDGATIANEAELIVAKQRGGRTGVAKARYNTGTLLFEG